MKKLLCCLGSPLLSTPNFDRLAESGLNMMDAHCTAPTSTPSRYSLMTGLYPWRNAEAEILPGDANLLITTTQPTLPKMMRESGYATVDRVPTVYFSCIMVCINLMCLAHLILNLPVKAALECAETGLFQAG